MVGNRAGIWTVAALVASLSVASLAQAAPTKEQSAKVTTAQAAIQRGGTLFRAKKFKEAGVAIKEAQEAISELTKGDTKEVAQSLDAMMKQLTKAHELLELEGISLPPLPTLPAAPSAAKPATPGTPAPPAVPGVVSFAKDVAPMLNTRCGRCHVMGQQGGFSLATFASFKKGTKDGVVFFPGNSKGSRIIEVIDSGDMPRGGAKLTDEQYTSLTKWIDQGAKFDGPSEDAPIGDYARAQPREKVEVTQASGNEAVLFARDIAPVLDQHCTGCHGARQPSGDLGLTTFNALLRGGDGGLAITPGKPAESLLIKKLKGTAGDRMPRRKPPLPDATIAKFEAWIAGGAKFDGPSDGKGMVLEDLVLLMKAVRANHDELAELRSEQTAKNWQLALSDSKPEMLQTEHFLLYGNVAPEILADVGKEAEAQIAPLEKMFMGPSDKPFIKGKMTLYVFDKRFDYGEIGQMVERREIPTEWRGHFRYTIVDAYGAINPSRTNEYPLGSLIGQQVAGVYVSSLGSLENKVPHWFAEGSARAIASKLDLKDPRVRKWDDQIAEVLSRSPKADSFLTGNLPPEEADILSYSFVKGLMQNGKAYNAVLNALRSGSAFDKAFSQSFGSTPNQLAAVWARSPVATTKGKRGK